jgi:hypothetical protein
LIDEEREVVRFLVHLDLEYPQTKRSWVVELIIRLNAELVIGSFDFCWDTGSVLLRIGVDLRHTPMNAKVAEDIINLAAFNLALFERGYACRSNRKISPRAAVEAAMWSEQATERREVSSFGRRGVLRVLWRPSRQQRCRKVGYVWKRL